MDNLLTTMSSITRAKFELTGQKWYRRNQIGGPSLLLNRFHFQIQITTTCQVARMIGLEAARRKVKAYVRLQHPFYQTSSKGSHDEKDDPKPVGVVGAWWHETLRMLASIDEFVLSQFFSRVVSLIGCIA